MLENTLESPLDCKEIQPVHSEGDQPWDFFGRNDAKAEIMQETRVGFLGWEDPLEKEMATHSSVLAWRIPGTAEPGGLPSMGSHRVTHHHIPWARTHIAPPPPATAGDLRDMGLISGWYQTHPRSQASPRGEGKDSALLSSRDGYPLEPKSGLKRYPVYIQR